MLEKMDDLTSCSLSYVASILGGKWKPFIVWYLSMAPGKRARYSELRKSIPYDISHKMFSQHLSELEQVGIIERVVVEVKPLRVDYLLTEKGISFANVLYFIVRRLFCGDAAAHEGHDGRGRAGVRQRRRRLRAGGCGAYHLAIRSFDVRRAHRLARRRRTRRRRARSVVFGRSSEGPARALSGLADRLAAPLGFLSITRLSHFQVRSALISALLRQYSRVNRIRGKNRISK